MKTLFLYLYVVFLLVPFAESASIADETRPYTVTLRRLTTDPSLYHQDVNDALLARPDKEDAITAFKPFFYDLCTHVPTSLLLEFVQTFAIKTIHKEAPSLIKRCQAFPAVVVVIGSTQAHASQKIVMDYMYENKITLQHGDTFSDILLKIPDIHERVHTADRENIILSLRASGLR